MGRYDGLRRSCLEESEGIILSSSRLSSESTWIYDWSLLSWVYGIEDFRRLSLENSESEASDALSELVTMSFWFDGFISAFILILRVFSEMSSSIGESAADLEWGCVALFGSRLIMWMLLDDLRTSSISRPWEDSVVVCFGWRPEIKILSRVLVLTNFIFSESFFDF